MTLSADIDGEGDASSTKKKPVRGIFFTHCGTSDLPTNTAFLKEVNESFWKFIVVLFNPLSKKLKKSRSLPDLSKMTRSGPTQSSSDISPNKQKHIRAFISRNDKAVKYIPITDDSIDLYKRSKIDEKAMLNWLDVQAVYNEYHNIVNISYLPTKSKSDTSVSLDDCSSKEVTKRMFQLKKQIKNFKAENLANHKRFKDDQQYINTASAVRSDDYSQIKLCIKMSEDHDSRIKLCNLKTDLSVKCLKSFFHPYADSMISWLPEPFMIQQIDECVEKNMQHPLINGTLDPPSFKKYKAILCLSRQASQLLRHNDLVVFDTLAKTLQIQRHELLVFTSVNQ